MSHQRDFEPKSFTHVEGCDKVVCKSWLGLYRLVAWMHESKKSINEFGF